MRERAVLCASLLVFAVLAVACRVIYDEAEQSLLQERTDEASAVLGTSVSNIRAPLDAAATLASVTNGDPEYFAQALDEQVGGEGTFTSAALYRIGSGEQLASLEHTPESFISSKNGSCLEAAMRKREASVPRERHDAPFVRTTMERDDEVYGRLSGADEEHRVPRTDRVENSRVPRVAHVSPAVECRSILDGEVGRRKVANGEHHLVHADSVRVDLAAAVHVDHGAAIVRCDIRDLAANVFERNAVAPGEERVVHEREDVVPVKPARQEVELSSVNTSIAGPFQELFGVL